ncbi:MAG: hypothetical protein GF419_14105 [Ignavibacteriales bacterium]|nr:hypothetical protein [Ignavibacteriales bacterium]
MPDSARTFHFNGYGEALYGVRKKLYYLDSNDYNIGYAILAFEGTLRKVDPPAEVVALLHPEVSGRSWIEFWGKHLQAYFALFPEHLSLVLFGSDANNDEGVLPARLFEEREKRYKAQTIYDILFLNAIFLSGNGVGFHKGRALC